MKITITFFRFYTHIKKGNWKEALNLIFKKNKGFTLP